MPFTTIDWCLILGYLVLAFGTGIALSRQAGKSLVSYFAADRSLPWWWLGTSMLATTFAADTPLAVAGITAKNGIAGNWLWWSWALGYAAFAVFTAARWRSAEVLTDAELLEVRYGGKPAAFLRAFKAGFLAIVLNCIILGWVFRAMSKIADPFIRWKEILGPDTYTSLLNVWPSWLVFDNPNHTFTILSIFSITVVYSSMGGIRGVILTDLVQFTMALVGSILFAVYAMSSVGGASGLIKTLSSHYPEAEVDAILSFTPSFDAALMPLQVFLVYIFVQWWAKHESDGTGYLCQRAMTARTPQDATKGALWFTIGNFVIRTWPWVIIGLVGLAVFPKGNETVVYAEGVRVAADREMAYPILMKLLLPPGVLGLLFASLLAAFMSTADTHLNWGTSYLINDWYKRFIKPGGSDAEYVKASRIALVGLAIAAIFIASQIGSIEKAWKFFFALSAGMGLPMLLRWVWWRVNAWTEITGMIAAIVMTIVLTFAAPGMRGDYTLFWTALFSTVCALIATFLTPPEDEATLKAFYEKVKPVGWWGSIGEEEKDLSGFKTSAAAWALVSASVYLLMFSVGKFVLGAPALGAVLLVLGAASLNGALKLLDV
ncbi:MAG: sodium transporter [Elusimicrobia bacterium]|nr:MAG: sodium transporter [Elusimicrobiota bacterium]